MYYYNEYYNNVNSFIESIITFITCSGKLLRSSKYEEEISDGHLGINEKELNSMNKHIPGNFQLLWRINRKTVFRVQVVTITNKLWVLSTKQVYDFARYFLKLQLFHNW